MSKSVGQNQLGRLMASTALCLSAVLGVSFVAAPVAKAGLGDVFDTAMSTVAAGFDFVWPDEFDVDELTFKLGGGVGVTPDYIGSDDYRLRFVPLIDIRYGNILSLQGTKLRMNLVQFGDIKAGPMLNYRFGRSESRSTDLTGMGDVPDVLQAGAFAEARFGSLFINAELRQSLGKGLGAEGQIIVAQGLFQNEDLLVVAGARAKWGSANFNQANFGVTTTQAANTSFAVHTPGSAFNSLGINLYGRYQITDTLRMEGITGFSKILGGPGDSPLVGGINGVGGVGSTNQFIAGVGLRYTF
jgi:MipA family protein